MYFYETYHAGKRRVGDAFNGTFHIFWNTYNRSLLRVIFVFFMARNYDCVMENGNFQLQENFITTETLKTAEALKKTDTKCHSVLDTESNVVPFRVSELPCLYINWC